MDPEEITEIPLFVEEQRLRQWWLWLILVPSIGVVWFGFWQQIVLGKKFGNNPGPDWIWWILFPVVGVGLPWMLYTLLLSVEVRQDKVLVRFTTPLFPLFRKTIPMEKILRAEAVTYRPLRDYGGWGIRCGAKGTAYTMSGHRGVRLEVAEGTDILIGSQQPDQLAATIAQARADQKPFR